MKQFNLLFNNKTISINLLQDMQDNLISILFPYQINNDFQINAICKEIKERARVLKITYHSEELGIKEISLPYVLNYEVINAIKLIPSYKPENLILDSYYAVVYINTVIDKIDKNFTIILQNVKEEEGYKHVIMYDTKDRFKLINVIASIDSFINNKGLYIF